MPPITNAVRRLRFDHGEMTQADLAARIGMTRQTVAAIEQNKYAPSLEAAFRIARVFGVSVGGVTCDLLPHGGRSCGLPITRL